MPPEGSDYYITDVYFPENVIYICSN